MSLKSSRSKSPSSEGPLNLPAVLNTVSISVPLSGRSLVDETMGESVRLSIGPPGLLLVVDRKDEHPAVVEADDGKSDCHPEACASVLRGRGRRMTRTLFSSEPSGLKVSCSSAAHG